MVGRITAMWVSSMSNEASRMNSGIISVANGIIIDTRMPW